jgi:hypothetical protein
LGPMKIGLSAKIEVKALSASHFNDGKWIVFLKIVQPTAHNRLLFLLLGYSLVLSDPVTRCLRILHFCGHP